MTEMNGIEDLIDSSGSPLFDSILRISLFIGAIFQLVCIFAVIFLPGQISEDESESGSGVDDLSESSTTKSKAASSSVEHHKSATSLKTNKKHEKKKKK